MVSLLWDLQAIQIFLKSQLSDLSAVRTPEKDQMIRTEAVVVTTVHWFCKLCVVPSQLKNLYCLGDWDSLQSDFQIILVTF